MPPFLPSTYLTGFNRYFFISCCNPLLSKTYSFFEPIFRLCLKFFLLGLRALPLSPRKSRVAPVISQFLSYFEFFSPLALAFCAKK